MKFDVTELPEVEKEFSWEVSKGWLQPLFEGEELFRALEPLDVTVKLLRTEEAVYFRGSARGKVGAVCVRCLEEGVERLDLSFSGRYQPRGPEDYDEPDEADLFFYEGDELDMGDALRENVLLSLPMNPVCREDCLGLCPDCGINQNVSSCRCREEVVDSRWAALQEIKNSLPK